MTSTIEKVIAYKRQSGLGSPASGSGGQLIVTNGDAIFTEQRDAVQLNEKRPDRQVADVMHANSRVVGSLPVIGRLGSTADFWESLLQRSFASITAIESGAGDAFSLVGATGILTRAAGGGESFLTDGLRTGHVVRLANMTASGVNARNLMVTAVTATTATLVATDGGAALVDSADSTTATMTVVGQSTFIPASAHATHYYTFEEYYQGDDISILSTDCQVGSVQLSYSIGSPISETWSFLGLNQTRASGGASSQVLTTPGAASLRDALRPSRGFAWLDDGSTCALVSAQLTVERNLSTDGRLFCGINASDITEGQRITVSGSFELYFGADLGLANKFASEQAFAIGFLNNEVDQAEPEPFRSVYLPRIRANSFERNDADRVTASVQFDALVGTGVGDNPTSIQIQDSTLS